MLFYSTEYHSPIGLLTLASEGSSLVGLWLNGQKLFMDTLPSMPIPRDNLEIFYKTRDWLDRYFTGKMPVPGELPLRPIGSPFRQAVWKCLCEIPYGSVTTYGTIARTVGLLFGKDKMSAQAVGGAVGHNPISIIIPCHRVIGSDGSLTGYAGGIDKKIRLLQHEGVDVSRM